MDYFEAFEKVKKSLEKLPVPKLPRPFAVQVRLMDEDCGGIFYVRISDGTLVAEPYDYYDNDADILTHLGTLLDILSGKLDIKKAVSDKTISVSGNIEALTGFFAGIKKDKPAKKSTSQKKIVTKKKTEGKKMPDDKKKPQEEDIIHEVVEKETKPKK